MPESIDHNAGIILVVKILACQIMGTEKDQYTLIEQSVTLTELSSNRVYRFFLLHILRFIVCTSDTYYIPTKHGN